MRPTVEEYWEQQVDVLEKKYGLGVEMLADIELEGGDLYRGQVNARIFFYDEAIHLTVHETVEVDERGTVHRILYAYQLMVRGIKGPRWHHDPKYPTHLQYHIDDDLTQRQAPDDRRSLMAVVDACWPVIDSIEEGIRKGEIVLG